MANVTPTAGPTKDTAVKLGKYQVTAGRMRAFLEDVGYNVRAFVQQARADGKVPVITEKVNLTSDANNYPVLDAAWDLYLPTGFGVNAGAGEINTDGAQNCTGAGGGPPCTEGPPQGGIYTAIRNHLGGTIFKNNAQSSTGCYVGSPGTHSFRFPDGMQDGSPPAQPEELYDTKTLNCVDYLVAQAFCVWDGGRLENFSEWQAAWGAGTFPWGAGPSPVSIGSASYWGCRFPWATDADQSQCGLPRWAAYQQADDGRSNEYADYQYSYEYPKLGGADYIVFLTAPGRTKGRGPLGHADVIGAGFELTSSVNYSTDVFAGRHRWAGNGSWEVHGYSKSYGGNTMLLNKYGKLGLRCVKFASYE
jgi:formylglycine-generating enzyme required for sulfatase activity